MARWDQIGNSGDVEDRRGLSGAGLFAGGGGIVVILITLALNYFGVNVSPDLVQQVVSSTELFGTRQVDPAKQPAEFRGDDSYEVFTKKVLGSTNTAWSSLMQQSGETYQKPRLVLFRGSTNSACGGASSAMGPHYCPTDRTIYLDETFFDELKRQFGGSTGDVAQAYVIAHEVGHNVQNQLGALGNARSDSVEIELQADCYAGVWAFAEAKNNLFENGDIQQALDAAAAVGDDNIQRRSGQQVSPETWTHGSSAERMDAFNVGYKSGQPGQCVDLRSS